MKRFLLVVCGIVVAFVLDMIAMLIWGGFTKGKITEFNCLVFVIISFLTPFLCRRWFLKPAGHWELALGFKIVMIVMPFLVGFFMVLGLGLSGIH